MVCDKCGYQDKKEVTKYNFKLCQFCNFFSPNDEDNFTFYINEKIDWKMLDTFRKYGQGFGSKQKEGMTEKAQQGKVVTRVALGYSLVNEELVQNEDASRVHSLFRTFLEGNSSLNSLSKNYGLSVNGLKKVLKNRTYLGEVKFDGRIHKSSHKPIITPEIFYAVQRKLQEISRKPKPVS